MSNTIDDFRYYYEPDVERKQFNINEAILSSIRLISSELFYDGINVTFKSGDLKIEIEVNTNNSSCYNFRPVYFDGYASEFKQIILNLIRNAKESIKLKKFTQ